MHLLRCQNLWLLQLLGLPCYPSSASLAFYTSGFILIAPLASLASLARSLRSPCQYLNPSLHALQPSWPVLARLGASRASKTPQRTPKTSSRDFQSASKNAQNVAKSPPDEPRHPKKNYVFFLWFFNVFTSREFRSTSWQILADICFPRHLQDVQKSSKHTLKSAQDLPKKPPDASKTPPKEPRRLQEPSKPTPGLPKNLIFPLIFQ